MNNAKTNCEDLTSLEIMALRMAVTRGQVVTCGSFSYDMLVGMQMRNMLTEIGHDMFSASSYGHKIYLEQC